MRGRLGPCATRQIFVRGQFAPGKDVPGHRAQSPKLRTLVTSEFISSREVQSFRACGIEMCVVNRAQSLPPTVSPNRHHPLLFSVLRDSIHSRDLGNPANELSPTISPHREDHPPPFRGWRGTKAGLGIRNSLDRRQGDLYKGTREGIMPS